MTLSRIRTPFTPPIIEDVEYEDITEAEGCDGDPLNRPEKKSSWELPKLPQIRGWRVVLIVFLIMIGSGIIHQTLFGDDPSSSSQVTSTTTGAKVKILVNGEETWVVPGDQIIIDLETSRPNDFTLVTNLPGPGGSNDHFFRWDHDPEIILENGDGVKRKGNESFPASWGNAKYRVHSTVKGKKATFRLFKMER